MFETIEQYATDFIENPKSEEFANKFVSNLRDKSGLFVETENVLFDYKDKFPDKTDRSHMASFYRITLALYNTFGGILVLGVNDDGTLNENKSKNIPNIENFNKELREISNHDVGVKRYFFDIRNASYFELSKDERLKKMLEFQKVQGS